jgi:aminoglycoside phosphotransferase (APT) family kinase protein
MPDKPAAEVVIDEPLVRRLCLQAAAVVPDIAQQPLARVAEGWDCEVWRLGADLAVRLPRRAVAAALILNEQAALPVIGPAVAETGIAVPIPVFAGGPGRSFPWPWSIVPWTPGTSGLAVPRADRTPWGAPLAHALQALHRPAPDDAPVNPMRGRPLIVRASGVQERLSMLRADPRIPRDLLHGAELAWERALAAAEWSRPPVWMHGDLHPGNLVAEGEHLRAMIDFGDVTAGDPAGDLAIAWLAFDENGRDAFIRATGGRYDAADWLRAKGWAAVMAMLLLAHSDDEPDYGSLGIETLHEVSRP